MKKLVLGVLAGGLVLSQAAWLSPASASAAAPAAAASAAATEGDILAGKRQVVIKPVEEFESILAVDARGRLNLTDGDIDKGLFVLVPNGNKWLIKTAKADPNGEPACMGLKNNGSNPLTVVAALCDAGRAGQNFAITKLDATDSSGRPTYAISSRDAFLQYFGRSGLIAEELGDAPLKTTFSFVDNGPSTLPILD
ncbi:hypothetical protein [Actinoplanes sp. RD1]|uniref:hypothetical protein n=1 Tax=Actinoplanes sp. RD1 TaxID=3064538 RepID=UPI002741EBE8|nr:hypothetical protein [Actinoplanes sp. RD1]